MPDVDYTRLVRDLADMRMQVNALEVTAKTTSLPETMRETRKTVRGAALAIALALVVSSALRFMADRRVEKLEQRIEVLEAAQKATGTPR